MGVICFNKFTKDALHGTLLAANRSGTRALVVPDNLMVNKDDETLVEWQKIDRLQRDLKRTEYFRELDHSLFVKDSKIHSLWILEEQGWEIIPDIGV